MGFKIGDRVRFKSDCRDVGSGIGVIIERAAAFDWRVQTGLGLDDYELLEEYELTLLPDPAPRGPKPLTLTGGTRFTVRRGYAMDRSAYRRYPLDSYLCPFRGAGR